MISFERSARATVRRSRWVVAASLVVAEIQSGTSASFRKVAGSFVFPSMQFGSVTWPTDVAQICWPRRGSRVPGFSWQVQYLNVGTRFWSDPVGDAWFAQVGCSLEIW